MRYPPQWVRLKLQTHGEGVYNWQLISTTVLDIPVGSIVEEVWYRGL